MAVRTKLHTADEDHDTLEVVDELDAVYLEDLQQAGLDDFFMKQFRDITRMLQEEKEKRGS